MFFTLEFYKNLFFKTECQLDTYLIKIHYILNSNIHLKDKPQTHSDVQKKININSQLKWYLANTLLHRTINNYQRYLGFTSCLSFLLKQKKNISMFKSLKVPIIAATNT